MKIVSCLLAGLLVAGCSLFPTKVVKEPVEVMVPVPTRCKVKFPVRPEVLDLKTLRPGVYDRAVALIMEGAQYRLYAKELEAALEKCADPE